METSIHRRNRGSRNAYSRGHHHDDGPDILIQRLFAHISEISTLPQIALHTLRIVNDPRSSAADLADVAQTDPAFATRVLRTVNSSFFGLQQPVTNLDHAVVLLGFREMRNLALTTHVASLFQSTTGHGRYSRQDLWLHMVSTAVVAKHIARVCRAVAPEDGYLAGLLHDVGIILLDQTLHRPFCQVLDAMEENSDTAEIEDAILGFDHAALGYYALTKWGIPDWIAQGAAYHHRPLACHNENRRLVCTVALANSICHRMGVHSLGAATQRSLPQEVFAILGVTKSEVTRIVQDLPAQLDGARELAMLSLECQKS